MWEVTEAHPALAPNSGEQRLDGATIWRGGCSVPKSSLPSLPLLSM